MSTLQHRILDGKYRLVRQLEEGGMGSVWFAEHLSLHSPVAVKLIGKEVADSEEGLQRFLREARTAASIRSPHVVQILDYGVDLGTPYIVMELLDGESLAGRLERVGPLTARETERIIRHVSRAVSRAHDAGIVHRDLKPANVYIIDNDDEEVIKLLDFGIAKAASDAFSASIASNTRTGAFLGTPFYVSPEQAEGIKTIDHRTDIWSMGVIAYECLLGHPPFKGETFGSLVLSICSRPLPVPSRLGDVPPAFDAWFARACARDVDARFQTARDAANELRLALEGAVLDAAAPPRSPVPSPLPERPGVAGASTARAPVVLGAVLPGPAGSSPSSSDLGVTTAAASSAAVTERTSPPGRSRQLVLAALAAAIVSLGFYVLRRDDVRGPLEPRLSTTAPASASESPSAGSSLPEPSSPVPPARPIPPPATVVIEPSPALPAALDLPAAAGPVVAPVVRATDELPTLTPEPSVTSERAASVAARSAAPPRPEPIRQNRIDAVSSAPTAPTAPAVTAAPARSSTPLPSAGAQTATASATRPSTAATSAAAPSTAATAPAASKPEPAPAIKRNIDLGI